MKSAIYSTHTHTHTQNVKILGACIVKHTLIFHFHVGHKRVSTGQLMITRDKLVRLYAILLTRD